MVGMTSMPEAALAREAGLDYASLCINANWGAGLESEPVTMEAIESTGALAYTERAAQAEAQKAAEAAKKRKALLARQKAARARSNA